MLTTSDLLAMDNNELYEVYVQAYKDRDLNVINVIRSIIYDRYSIRALEQSPIDCWRNNKEITRFFAVNKL